MSTGDFPEILSQQILVEIILVGRLGVCARLGHWRIQVLLGGESGRAEAGCAAEAVRHPGRQSLAPGAPAQGRPAFSERKAGMEEEWRKGWLCMEQAKG